MIYIYIALGLAVWFGCGAIAAGFRFAYFQRKYVEIRAKHFSADKAASKSAIRWGLVSFLVVATNEDYRTAGWLWPWSAKARKEAGL